MPKGSGARKSELEAFGKYRKTTAVAQIQDKSTRATFEASIRESSRWQLDYHTPVEMSWLASQPEVKYRLAITNEQETWDIDLAVGALVQGWNSVGEFELNAGYVSVDLTGTTEGVYLYADAIRWTRVSVE